VSRVVFRPLPAWTDPEKVDRRSAATFRAPWDKTLRKLREEAELLGADEAVIQVVVAEADLRQDGMLRTRARVLHPGAVVSMDTRHGPLRYATDTYEARYPGDVDWQANVRAIALALEALRAVDRYGVTRRGEQYVGWQALPATPADPTTPREAVALLAHLARLDFTPDPGNTAAIEAAYRAAARHAHPDHGGNPEDFKRLQLAMRILRGGPR